MFKKECPKHLQRLYPQIFQESYLTNKDIDGECRLFLQHLKSKKSKN